MRCLADEEDIGWGRFNRTYQGSDLGCFVSHFGGEARSLQPRILVRRHFLHGATQRLLYEGALSSYPLAELCKHQPARRPEIPD